MDGLFGGGKTTDIGITYTAQFCNTGGWHTGYHVHLVYWQDNVADGDKIPGQGSVGFIDLRNPVGWNSSAGMPYIDIGPYNNTDNYGAIVFVQLMGVDLYGPVAAIWIINSLHGNWSSLMLNRQALLTGDALYPSIALHYEAGMIDPPHQASVTYFQQSAAQSNQWNPWVFDIDLDTHFTVLNRDRQILGGVAITGIYNSDQIPFTNPGAASAIGVTGNNSYWATWSLSWLMEPPPTTVQAAFGNPQ
jgi:hypothetical protein